MKSIPSWVIGLIIIVVVATAAYFINGMVKAKKAAALSDDKTDTAKPGVVTPGVTTVNPNNSTGTLSKMRVVTY